MLDHAIALVTDGQPVDWSALVGSAVTDSEREALRLLQKLTEAFPDGPLDTITNNNVSSVPLASWGHLSLTAEIGRGAYGVVYRAWDTHLERDVALKLFHENSPREMLQEAQRLARISHPSVVSIYGVDQRDGRVGLWMELLRGVTLDTILSRQGPFSAKEATAIGLDVCSALAAIHAAGLIHRDIKAQNVVREPGGRIVLMDLGASDLLSPSEAHVRSLAGTPLYMAPELFAGADASVASDIYALGVLMYRLVTAAYPVEGETLGDVRRAHQSHRPIPLRDARPDLPTDFVAIVEQCLAKDPLTRYRRVSDLERALATAHGAAWPAPATPRVALAGIVLAIALLASGGTWVLVQLDPTSSAEMTHAGSLTPDQYALFAGYEELAYERLDQQPSAAAAALRSAMALARPALPGLSGQFALLYVRLAEAERRAGNLDEARRALRDAEAHAASVLADADPIRSLIALEQARILEASGDIAGARSGFETAKAVRRAVLEPLRHGGEDPTGSAFLTVSAHHDHIPATLGWQSHARFPAHAGPVKNGPVRAWSVEAIESMAYYYQRLPPALTARALAKGFSLFARLRPEEGLAALAVDLAPNGPRFDVFVRRIGADRLEIRTATSVVPRMGPVFVADLPPSGMGQLIELRFDSLVGSAALFVDGKQLHDGYVGHNHYQDTVAGVVSWGVMRDDADGSPRPAASFDLVWFQAR